MNSNKQKRIQKITTMKKIGIFGCSGFIGSHLVERLLDSTRYKIIGADITQDKIGHLVKNPDFEFYKININDLKKSKELLKKCDTVISLAALCNPALYNTIPLEVIDSNFTQPHALVSLCAELGVRIIHFSTCEVYGKTIRGVALKKLTDPEDEANYLLSEDSSQLIMGPINAQRWTYAAAKQLLERVIYAYGEQDLLEYTIIRPFNFIGSRMDFIPGFDGNGIPRVIACFMESLLLNKPLKLVDGGKNTRSFTSIHDAIDAIVKIIELPEQSKNQIFNIGNPNNEFTIQELAEMFISLYKELYPDRNYTSKIISVPSAEFYGKGYEDSDKRVPDISKAQRLLGWYPNINIMDALKETIVSYVDYYGKKWAA